MKHYLFSMIIFLSFHIWAQTEDLDAAQKGFQSLTRSGKLFQVQLKPAEKHMDLFVTGVPTGHVSVDDAKIEASIGRGENQQTLIAEKIRDEKTGKFFYRLKRSHKQPLKLNIQSGDNKESISFPPPQ